jgi:hypothetical protein
MGTFRYVFDQTLQLHGIRWQLLFGSSCVHTSIMYRRAIVWQKLGGYDQLFSRNLDFDLVSRVSIE